jgi:hypothetical protein
MLTHHLPSFTSTTSIRQYVNAPVLSYQSPCTPVKLQMPDFWHFSHLCYCSVLCSSISIDLDRCCLMLLLAIPQAVELSVCTRVAGCGHPISSNVVLVFLHVCSFQTMRQFRLLMQTRGRASQSMLLPMWLLDLCRYLYRYCPCRSDLLLCCMPAVWRDRRRPTGP